MLLKQIELFVTVARHENLGRAAQHMHISASSVCQRLKSLENELGVELYHRNKEGIELTGPGRTLLATANRVLDKLNAVKETLSRDSKAAAESLTIGGTSNPATKYLPGVIAAFQRTHPNVKLTFTTGDRSHIQKLLRRSAVDIAVIQTPSKSSDFNLEDFATDHLMFFAHPAHPLTRKKTLNLQDFARTRLVVRAGRGTAHKMLKQLGSRGMAPNVVLRCTSPDAVKAAVRKKMGIGILFFNQIERDVARKELTILNFVGLPRLMGSSHIVYCKNRALSRAASEFLDFLRSLKITAINRPGLAETTESSAIIV
jgi:DNA-binding transcriptional LysR family regulator